jgi:hypothetical protein
MDDLRPVSEVAGPKVDDRATLLLLARFFQDLLGKRLGLEKSMSKAEPLDEAKRWLRRLSADQDWRCHEAVTDWTLSADNFRGPVRTLGVKDDRGRRPPRRPAMAAGLANRVGTMAEWLSMPAARPTPAPGMRWPSRPTPPSPPPAPGCGSRPAAGLG